MVMVKYLAGPLPVCNRPIPFGVDSRRRARATEYRTDDRSVDKSDDVHPWYRAGDLEPFETPLSSASSREKPFVRNREPESKLILQSVVGEWNSRKVRENLGNFLDKSTSNRVMNL